MSLPNKHCEMPGEVTPPTWSSEWRARKAHATQTDYAEITAVIVAPLGKRFEPKRLREERIVCRLEYFTNVPQDGALCEATVEVSDEPFGAEPLRAEPVAMASKAVAARALALRRAGQRWSALVTAPTSRIARLMSPVLGESLWAKFVAHANAHYKNAFFAAFDGLVLRCVGSVCGGSCPHSFEVDLTAPDAAVHLAHLHLDHEQDLQITCDMWQAALPPTPASWDDGIDGHLLCHLLFGGCDDDVHGPAMVRFRCGPLSFGSVAGYCA